MDTRLEYEQYSAGMSPSEGGPGPEATDNKPFVFAEVDPRLLAEYETETGEGRIKSFVAFLSDYIKKIRSIDKEEGSTMIQQINAVQKDQSLLTSRQRYINSANRLNGLISIMSDPKLDLEDIDDDIRVKDVPSLIRTNGDIDFLRVDVKRLQDKLADPLVTDKQTNDFAVLGQKRLILSFYEDAKRHFFPDIPKVPDDPDLLL